MSSRRFQGDPLPLLPGFQLWAHPPPFPNTTGGLAAHLAFCARKFFAPPLLQRKTRIRKNFAAPHTHESSFPYLRGSQSLLMAGDGSTSGWKTAPPLGGKGSGQASGHVAGNERGSLSAPTPGARSLGGKNWGEENWGAGWAFLGKRCLRPFPVEVRGGGAHGDFFRWPRTFFPR